MSPKEVPSDEVAAAMDEYFQKKAAAPPEPADVATEPTPPTHPAESAPEDLPPTPRPGSPFNNYVRELQQEFEEEQEEGKI